MGQEAAEISQAYDSLRCLSIDSSCMGPGMVSFLGNGGENQIAYQLLGQERSLFTGKAFENSQSQGTRENMPSWD